MPAPKGYRRKKLANWRRVCAKGSLRTVKSGKARVIVCCPKGKWGKNSRCKVGMRAVSLDVPRAFGGYRKDYSRVLPMLTRPYVAALDKIGTAGIGKVTTPRKKAFFLKYGLIRPVTDPRGFTVGYEVTAKGWAALGSGEGPRVEWLDGLATDARRKR